LIKGDSKKIIESLHSVKGVASNLSADTVFSLAAELSEQVKFAGINIAASANIADTLITFSRSLQELRSSIITLSEQWGVEPSAIGKETGQETTRIHDDEKLAQLLQDLADKLLNCQYINDDDLQQLSPYLIGTEEEKLACQLLEQINLFDNKNAIITLHSLSASHHIELNVQ